MTRRIIDPLNTLIAVILLFMGQGYLILPQHSGGMVVNFTPALRVAIGFLFVFTGMAILARVTHASRSWKDGIVNFLSVLALSGLAYQYAITGRDLEMLLSGGLALFIPISSFVTERYPQPDRRLLTFFSTLLNLAAGAGLIFLRSFQHISDFDVWTPYRLPLGVIFLLSSAAGGYILLKPFSKGRRITSKLTAIPWLGWGLLCALESNFASLIPSIFLAGTIIFADYIPWERLKLPSVDILGKRFILIAAILQTIFLTVTVSLLDVGQLPEASPVWEHNLLTTRELLFLLILGMELVLSYGLVNTLLMINGLSTKTSGKATRPSNPSYENSDDGSWSKRVERLIGPFTDSTPNMQKQVDLLNLKIQTLNEQLAIAKQRTIQLTMLAELSQQLESKLDVPVASQLAINTLQRALNCSLAVLYIIEPERYEMAALAAAGTRANILPPGYRQTMNTGILGRAARLKKTQVVNDSRLEPEFVKLTDDEPTVSTVVVPLVNHGHVKAFLEINSDEVNAFSGSDVQIAEAVAAELLRAWERSDYHQRLTDLIQAGISLTTQPTPQKALDEVAIIARHTLRARFTYVVLMDQEENTPQIATAGLAPRLHKSIRPNPNEEPLLRAALNSTAPFRVRDLRKYKHTSHIDIDLPALRTVLAIPIRVQRQSVGAILAFGKQKEVFFSENDESLAGLLSSQAAAAIESAWLSNEVRENLTSATQLYQLSTHIIQAQELHEAAGYIVEAAQKVSGANSSGILLLTPDNQVEAEAHLDANGTPLTPQHPIQLIHQALKGGQSIFHPSKDGTYSICFPLKTPSRIYGALWLLLPNRSGLRFSTNLQTLANQAAVALERLLLLAESRDQARGLESAYKELETSYDHTLAALMSALDARDRETEGHSLRVAHLACKLGENLDLTPAQLKSLERGSLLHDIGKIGIRDTILLKPGPLDPAEWEIMRTHPSIGARIVEGIPFLEDTQAVIRYHQERWDGSGYPLGLSGKDIPYLARIFAVADALDALTSNRPYRPGISREEALKYLHEQAGILFDPSVVSILEPILVQESYQP